MSELLADQFLAGQRPTSSPPSSSPPGSRHWDRGSGSRRAQGRTVGDSGLAPFRGPSGCGAALRSAFSSSIWWTCKLVNQHLDVLRRHVGDRVTGLGDRPFRSGAKRVSLAAQGAFSSWRTPLLTLSSVTRQHRPVRSGCRLSDTLCWRPPRSFLRLRTLGHILDGQQDASGFSSVLFQVSGVQGA